MTVGVSVEGENSDDTQTVKNKRPVKLTYKALAEEVEMLQNVRKDTFRKLKKSKKSY